MKNVISLCCGRPNCPKLTLPVIKGEKYKPTDVFYLKDDYGNEDKLTFAQLLELAKVIGKLQKQD